MYFINHDDPRSTAAAALSLAEGLAPALDTAALGLRGVDAAAAYADLACGVEGPELFEGRTLAALRQHLAEIEAGVQRETASAVVWVPVRCIDGVEEFEPVSVTRRTPAGDALAATGTRLERLVVLIERTRALLAAERAIGRLR